MMAIRSTINVLKWLLFTRRPYCTCTYRTLLLIFESVILLQYKEKDIVVTDSIMCNFVASYVNTAVC